MATSIIELISADHEHVKEHFSELEEIPGAKLGDWFCELRELLVRHEVAEEVTLYPALRSEVAGGDKIADARIAEQQAAESKLAELEKMDPQSPSFLAELLQLRPAVLEHAKKEESDVLSRLQAALGPERLEDLGRAYALAMSSAPTHAHPHAPDTPPGNLILGPVAAVADRMRDAIKKAS
ncbi:MAG: hemerythrin domain-containing protein [Actinomycetota bacterium]|nr:hemerythrin domain-containing protein [Actinomycetota bacterium]